jgi:hypothetical protein
MPQICLDRAAPIGVPVHIPSASDLSAITRHLMSKSQLGRSVILASYVLPVYAHKESVGIALVTVLLICVIFLQLKDSMVDEL